MKLIKSSVFAVVGGLLTASSSFAVVQVDQDQAMYDLGINFFTFSSATYAAQSFQQDHGNIVGAGILLTGNANSSDTVTISLYDMLPTDGGALLASASGVGSGGGWFDVFWPQVNITPLQTYYLVFSSRDSQNNGLGIASMDTVFDFYQAGNAFTTDQFIPWDFVGSGSDIGYDFAFRTYYEDGTRPPTHNTPDGGSTLAILGLSLALLGAVRSKR